MAIAAIAKELRVRIGAFVMPHTNEDFLYDISYQVISVGKSGEYKEMINNLIN